MGVEYVQRRPPEGTGKEQEEEEDDDSEDMATSPRRKGVAFAIKEDSETDSAEHEEMMRINCGDTDSDEDSTDEDVPDPNEASNKKLNMSAVSVMEMTEQLEMMQHHHQASMQQLPAVPSIME